MLETQTKFQDSFSQEVWEQTYKAQTDVTVDDTLMRVASSMASVEETEELQQYWTKQFMDSLTNFKVVVGGRIYANAGLAYKGTTLMNCFTSPRPKRNLDSLNGIFKVLVDQANTLKSEGGWGENFSWIRPRGTFIAGIGVETPGSVKYMELFDKSSEIITSGSGKEKKGGKGKGKIRKGAQMGILDVWHPDIVEFILAKQTPGRLTKFNVSVNCTNQFMETILKVKEATDLSLNEKVALDKWDLKFPDTTFEKYDDEWDGDIQLWESKNYPVVIHDTISASWLWNLIMESTYNRAEPGVLFLDRANQLNPSYYLERIFSSNPCVSGDTVIPTNKGLIRFDEIADRMEKGEKFNCFSEFNNEMHLTTISKAWKTGNRKTIKLHFSNGTELVLTPEHKLLTTDNIWIEAKDSLHHSFTLYANNAFNTEFDFPFEFNAIRQLGNNRTGTTNLPEQWTEDLGLITGWLIGDGWLTESGFALIFGQKDDEMKSRCERILTEWGLHITRSVDANNSTTFYINSVIAKELFSSLGVKKVLAGEKRVPLSVFQAPKSVVKNFLSALFSADGMVANMKNGNYWIALTSKSKQLLNDVQQLLLMFEITHHTTYHINTSSTFDYVKQNGERVVYIGGPYNDLRIFGKGIEQFEKEIGFCLTYKTEKLQQIVSKSFKNKKAIIKVVAIEEAETVAVYDLTEPLNHNFVVNGIVAHNCGEQVMPPASVCDLGTLNLTQFIDFKTGSFDLVGIAKHIKVLVRLLDNVNDYTSTPLVEYDESVKNKRRIGVGVLGWGSSLVMLKVRLGSSKAAELREQVMSVVAKSAYEASIDLAEEKGMFGYCDPIKHAEGEFIKRLNLSEAYMAKLRKFGIRNSSVLSCQPNGNTSIFANIVTGGIEPMFMYEYIRTVICPIIPNEIIDVTPKWFMGEWHETELFKFSNEGTDEMLKGVFEGTTYKIDKSRGLLKEVLCEDYGVRYLKSIGEWDPTHESVVTTSDLTVAEHLDDLNGFAYWIDSAISKTINITHDYPFEDFEKVYLDAFLTGNIKGLTTYRAGTMASVLSVKEEQNEGEEEIILDSFKFPDTSSAVMKKLTAEGKKWYLTVVLGQQEKPIALFVQTNSRENTIVTKDVVANLYKLAYEKNIPAKFIEDTIEKAEGDNNVTKITRMISLLLRHGVLIKNIVSSIDQLGLYPGSFVFALNKFLASYIKDGEIVEDEKWCETNSCKIVFSEGCKMCKTCGNSKC